MTDELVDLSLAELRRLRAAIVGGRVRAPVNPGQLLAEQLSAALPCVPLLARMPSNEAVTALLDAIVTLRERMAATPRPELVWTGPEPMHGRARQTSVVVRELFDRARREVFIAGYSFHGGEDLLAPLHAAMRDRGVTTQIVLDASQLEVLHATAADVILGRVVEAFWQRVWIHGEPRPALWYDPRTLQRSPPLHGGRWFPESSMHAKCIVVDAEEVLVGSANFTERAQTTNIEVGVAIRDRSFAEGLLYQWNAARSQGMILPVDPGAR